jgi:energy-coupling factor transporter transmembrane protein EcfT
MKKRYVYTLLFLVPGLTVSLFITGIVFAVVFGVLWLFVFGDSPWPAWTEWLVPALMLALFSSLWIGAGVTGYFVGKKREAEPGLDPRHLRIALVATVVPIFIVLLHQLGIGNIGPKSDGERCSEYCMGQGYAVSSMPPQDSGERSCSCLGERGEVALTLPLDALPR